MSNTLSRIVDECKDLTESQETLERIKTLFGYKGVSENFVEHMQKWKDAQPLTNMTIIEKLDKLCNKADEVACNSSSYEEEVSRALSALEDVPYDLSHDAYGLQDDIKALMNEIKKPKEQAETDMEDSE